MRIYCKVNNDSFGRVVMVYACNVWWIRRPVNQTRSMVRNVCLGETIDGYVYLCRLL
jgi:hypothetical protein